jgi:dTDP-4-amino-4,6-dideoxygalactose transaminase
MWPRKQLDISWSDFAFATAQAFLPAKRLEGGEVVGPGWIPRDEALVSLSVRSAWDLLLASLRLPAGSEVVMSAVTVPDMARIVEHHGLVALPIDVDPARLQPVLEDWEQAITPRTRVIIVAHLFGSRMDMGPIIELASKHNLLVVEDCAQAFVGREYAGHEDSDVCLFSFGPIKTATALGGCVARVRDAALLAEMKRRQREYPVQTRRSYLSRILRFVGIRLLTTRVVYTAAVNFCRKRGIDYDQKIAGLARSFAADRLFELIRRQPCSPLVLLIARRIRTFDGATARRLARRTQRSARVAAKLHPDHVIGSGNATHTYWVFPIRIPAENAGVIERLQLAGFDVTRLSSLIVVPRPPQAAAGPPLASWLEETVYLPNCEGMPDEAFERMASILNSSLSVPVSLPQPNREPSQRAAVVVAP